MTIDDGKKVWAALVEIGIDPVKILHNPIFPPLANEYVEGRITKESFHRAIENVNILSGGKLKGVPNYRIPLTSNN